MKITLKRFYDSGKDSLGLFLIDGKFAAFTIEDEKRDQKVMGETRIPAGTYKVDLRWSPKFSPVYNHKMLWIRDIPNFEFVLIHPGNKETDTAGCILVGNTAKFNPNGISMIEESKLAYLRIYAVLSPEAEKGNLTIEVIDN